MRNRSKTEEEGANIGTGIGRIRDSSLLWKQK